MTIPSHRHAAILALCLIAASCVTAHSVSAPFLVREARVLGAEEELSDLLGPREAVSPCTGAPYRTFEMSLDSGVVIHITATSPDFRPGISLFATNGTLVGTTDPGPANQASLALRIPRSGSYYLIVSGSSSGDFGPFDVRTRTIDITTDIELPGSVESHLYGGGPIHPTTGGYKSTYDLDIVQTMTLEITLRSSDFDAFLTLVTADEGSVVAENDDFGGTTDSRIIAELQPGSYEIWASSFSAGETGSFSLTIEETTIERSEELVFGDLFLGFLGMDREPIPGTQRTGDPVEIEIGRAGRYDFLMRSVDLDSYLVLTDVEGGYITEDDDSGGGLDARITTELEPGRYIIWPSSYALTESGRYTLLVEEFELPEARTSISFDSTIEGQLTESSPVCRRRGSRIEYYDLTIEEPMEVQIDLLSNRMDAYLFLEDGSGELIAENDDVEGSTNSRIIEELDPGTYRIGASAFDRHERGPFTVIVGPAGR